MGSDIDNYFSSVDENASLEKVQDSKLRVLSVSEFVDITSKQISYFGNASVTGEIQTISSRGHLYFTLKDELSSVDCIMWQNLARSLSFIPQPGAKVTVTGTPNLWQKNSSFRLICSSMTLSGRGVIMERLLRLKEKLRLEGVFDYHKREIPEFIDTVGIITSIQGDVVHDMAVTMKRRNPGVNIIVYDAKVQGEDAPSSLVAALKKANEEALCDVIIIGRGGGSFEDLLPFSDETLTREVARSNILVISAVGHEPDYSFTDYAADFRAATPTAAAEHVTRITKDMLINAVINDFDRMNNAITQHINYYSGNHEAVMHRLKASNPENYVTNCKSNLSLALSRLHQSVNADINKKHHDLSSLKQRLASFEPQSLIEAKRNSLNSLISRLNHAVDAVKTAAENTLLFDVRVAKLDRLISLIRDDRLKKVDNLVLRSRKTDIDKKFYDIKSSYMQTVSRLHLSDPLLILSKGYSLTTDEKDNVVNIDKISIGDTIKTRVKDGLISSKVENITKEKSK